MDISYVLIPVGRGKKGEKLSEGENNCFFSLGSFSSSFSQVTRSRKPRDKTGDAMRVRYISLEWRKIGNR